MIKGSTAGASDHPMDRYERFAPGDCSARLPLNEITEEHTFGQFVTLTLRLDGIARPLRLGGPPNPGASHDPRQLMTDAVGLDVAAGSGKGTIVRPRIQLDAGALNQFLATGELEFQGRKAQAKLSRGLVSLLLNGQAPEVLIGMKDAVQVVQLVPPQVNAKAPAVTEFQIGDLPAFLANPVVPGMHDVPYKLQLRPDTVASLLADGRAQLHVDKAVLNLEVGAPRVEKMFASFAVAPTFVAAMPLFVQPATDTAPPRRSGPYAALFLPWKQQWNLLGYSRGALLHSLSLAPQEETLIEIVTWDRRRRTLEQESETDTEQTFESANVSRDTSEVVNELTNSGEFQVQADARVRVTYPVVQVDVGAQFSRRDSVTQVAKKTAQHLTESTSKAATRVKTHRKTKITETMETGREQRVTRKLRNPNACRSLNLDYFEVVANYRIDTFFAAEDAAICALVEMPREILDIRLDDPATCRVHEKALTAALLDRNLLPAFEAARLLASRAAAKILVCDKVQCPHERASDRRDKDRTPPAGAAEVPVAVAEAFTRVLSEADTLRHMSDVPLMAAWDDGYEPPDPRSVAQFRGYLYWQLLWRLIPNLADTLIRLLEGDTQPSKPNVSALRNALPEPTASAQPGGLDGAQYKDAVDNIIETIFARYSDWWSLEHTWYWDHVRAFSAASPDGRGLPAALTEFQRALASSIQTQMQTVPDEHVEAATIAQQSDMDNDRLDYAYQLRELADAQERVDALIQHLKLHLSYYRYAILQAMPISDQMQLLASVSAPIDLCEPRIIGMIPAARGGIDRLAVPLNLALLEGAGETDAESRDIATLKEFVNGVTEALGEHRPGSRLVSLPTSGMTVESRLGTCTGCEPTVEEANSLDLEERRVKVQVAKAALEGEIAETRRREARLAAVPPLLDDPIARSEGTRVSLDPVHIILDKQGDS